MSFLKESSGVDGTVSLEEIAAAFGDIGDGSKLAELPTGIWGDDDTSFDSTWTADFSHMTVTECKKLKAKTEKPEFSSVSSTVLDGPPQSAPVGANATDIPLLSAPQMKDKSFQLHDPKYISRLERKLDKLYERNGRADKQSMLNQLRNRSDNMLNAASTHGSSTAPSNKLLFEDKAVNINIVSRKLFPEQAMTMEEKLKLVKYDHLLASDNETLETDKQIDMNHSCQSSPGQSNSTEQLDNGKQIDTV